MAAKNSVVALFDEHVQAEQAVKELQHAGFNMKCLSIIGKGYHTEEDVLGYYTTGDRMMYWGKNGAFWGGIWGMLFGSAFFMIPGVGPFIAAGPLVGWIVAVIESAVVVGGMSAIGAGLYSIGIPKESVLSYESSLKAGTFLVVAHGSVDEVEHARKILHAAGATDAQVHMSDAAVAAAV
jgi:hypothetical protein